MSNSQDKSTNGLGSDPLQRLASFKPPRDLSLGGVKPNKKVFTPNLNVTRSRNKGVPLANSREHKKNDKDKRDRVNNKNKRKDPSIIKSAGVFSEGLGAVERSHYRGPSYARDGEGAPALQRPTIRVKDVIKIDKELEEQKIKSVVGGDDGLDEEVEDFKQSFETDAPIKLPIDDGWLYSQPKPTVKIKQEVVVKTEPTEYADCPMPEVDKKPIIPAEFEDTNITNLLKSDKPTLILLQLPTSLPGRSGGGDANEDSRGKSNKETQDDPSEGGEESCVLSGLQEGRVGRLQVRRSGRVTLLLGDTVFEVCPGTKAAFHQEAVSVSVEDAARSARLVSLGPLQHKLTILPDWQTMFTDMAL
ncbi:PREDICTED: DNA-directed RNA polymerase III subunit RPC4 [Papilio xuthus]|uniref:DNA-directed RNA polymerase III subunit RPC4 n=1 Tax=Papilio xuthus TaxID=66420 RepID=A0A194PY41_PAPXU|nr:PREDICTED: DNA-directed RNA polymerase III subunit RPC4 [Papilio xuthus]KPI97669.1 DNA-directed RNA polymerase III subunit RPC4 [Papilio xuthus]